MEDAGAPRRDDIKNADIRYPENRVVGLLDSKPQLDAAVDALTSGGFLSSEIEVLHGAAASKELRDNTGRTGLAHLAMRLVESIGLPNDELAIKNQYADALAKGRVLITVLAPSDDRRQQAARILEEHGASSVKFLGQYTIEWPARAD